MRLKTSWLISVISVGFVVLMFLPMIGYTPQGFSDTSEATALAFDVSDKYQPDYEHPRQYSRAEMNVR